MGDVTAGRYPHGRQEGAVAAAGNGVIWRNYE